jgi:hypothetical protein
MWIKFDHIRVWLNQAPCGSRWRAETAAARSEFRHAALLP